ncbi:exodeoxyribonuclease V subunit gamma [Candidatus Vallotia lariciata]|uniref:exodeoxyribonuclease V subunit gamma n=1 Tax=Candidatus Vallotia laricis TaxID=2018052 RepID=UPI001D02DA6D|nr:exodeoxyribonuclease V subunit gamma [Candidatus Vallotia lariciata]UDG82653.1 exodeoxyribonuclease V subunit gamma [Candidatus Vallotia lariciata]
MLKLFYSNRYEVLTTALLSDLEHIDHDLWRPQTIIVPNMAVRRRLELDYADWFGLCANIEFCYLPQWLWTQIARVEVVHAPQESPFVPERLVWILYKLLTQRSTICSGDNQDLLSRLDLYLALADPVMIFDLANRISHIFNHYIIYRPYWLSQWLTGKSLFSLNQQLSCGEQWIASETPIQRADESWQAQLWRDILKELAGAGDVSLDVLEQVSPPAHRFLEIISKLDLGDVARANWPAQVSLFALPTIPLLHVQLLSELSRWIDIRIYILNPCREHWFNIIKNQHSNKLHAVEQIDYQRFRHPLLTEWGRQTQAQLALLHDHIDCAVASVRSKFIEASANSWLSVLQNSILSPKHPVSLFTRPELDGIEVHVCHSLMRQFEVLHNRLLAAFDADPSLTPADILIVVPDLIAAAPIVSAVFGMVTLNDPCRIPYRITGLPPYHANALARTLLDWLTLGDRTVNASALIEWLRVDEIAARYDIDPVALETVQRWLKNAGAFRSFSPNERRDVNTPRTYHTFSDALMRLFLGYAMPDNAPPVANWLPIAIPIGSADAMLLGRLAQFIDELDAFVLACTIPKTITQWRNLVNSAIKQFFGFCSSNSNSLSKLFAILNTLFVQIEASAPDTLLPAAVLHTALLSAMYDPSGGGVPSGAVTISSLSSLRGVSFRIICIAGIDDGVLPTRVRSDEFDLMVLFEQLGDWKCRDDDRNLFLDLILAARDTLLLSYTGRNIRDNSTMLPSALLIELLDYLALLKSGKAASVEDIALAHRSFITEHPLQSFEPSYFSIAGPLLTYDEDRAQTATAIANHACQNRTTSLFFSDALPPNMCETIRLEKLVRFWHHPQKVLLRERLGIVFHRAQTKLSDIEPYEFNYAARDALSKRILPLLVESSVYIERAYEIARALPELPGGATGRAIQEREVMTLSRLAKKIRDRSSSKLESVEFSFRVAPHWPRQLESVSELLDRVPAWSETVLLPTILSGVLDNTTHNELVLYRYARPTVRDYLDAWLRHLCWCVINPQASRQTLWVGPDTHFVFTMPQNPHIYLSELCALYRAGLRAPLRFFQKSGWLFMSKHVSAANQAWSNDRTGGELADPAIRLALRGTSMTLDNISIVIAKTVFEPLLAHLQLAEELHDFRRA